MSKKNLSVRKGRCINFGNCAKADAKEVQEVNLGDDFVCSNSDCGSDLQDLPPAKPLPIKQIVIVVAALVCLGFGVYMLFLRPASPPPVVSIEPASATVESDGTVRLTVKTEPEDAAKTLKWIWASSDESIATVSRNGVVTGVAPGNATITVTAENDLTIAATAEINVQAPEPEISVQEPETTEPDPQPTRTETPTPSTTTSVKTYSFGKYEGPLVNGRPQGRGTMTYNCRVQIAKMAQPRHTYYAEAGDSFTGTWHNGDIEHGVLTRRNGEQITITAGRRPSAYDLSNDRCE